VAYPEDLVGKYIRFNRTGTPLSEREKQSLDYILTGHSASLSVPVFTYYPGRRGAPGGPGAPPVPPRPDRFLSMPPWNICFLDYHPGMVTAVQLSQCPVLTGPMSGCFLFRYKEQDGSTWFAHVGTGESTEVSLQAKRKWKLYARSLGTDTCGQSPLHFFDDPTLESAAKLAGGAPQIYGLFEAAPKGKFYAVLLARIKSGVEGHGYVKVCALRESYLQPWDTIQKSIHFKDIST